MWSTITFHPYFNYTRLMNPRMVEVFSKADFIEIDITFKVSCANSSKWSPLTMTGASVSGIPLHVRVYTQPVVLLAVVRPEYQWLFRDCDCQSSNGQADKLRKLLKSCSTSCSSCQVYKHPLFQPGKTLRGIPTDMSDIQRAAPISVLGEELVTELCKGCKVG